LKNKDIANSFYTIADLLEIEGDNPFRIRAYRKAGDALLSLHRPIEGLSEEDLLHIQGIGKDIAGKIKEALTLGRISSLEELKEKVPEELLVMKKIPGLGPKKVSLFYRELNVDSIKKLRLAAEDGSLLKLPGIRSKTVENILKGIEFYEMSREMIPLGEAYTVSRGMTEYMRGEGVYGRIEVAGSIRRRKETVGDIDILAEGGGDANPVELLTHYPGITQVIAQGATKGSVRFADMIQADIRVVDRETFGSALQYFTGSKGHNVRLRHLAKEMGLKLSEYGLLPKEGGGRIKGREEEEIYGALGLPYIPPELREDSGEVEAALNRCLPNLVNEEMIRGELHLHTDWSDGFHSLDQVASFMKERGFEYFAVTDHSKSLRIAGGLSEEELSSQTRLIDKLNRSLEGITVLSGIEVDILREGTLDLRRSTLKKLDFVTGSIHTGLTQPREKAMRRIIAAIESGCVDMIGHLTGRLIGERQGYDVDVEKVLQSARKFDVVLEINSHPKRLDIDDLTCRLAKEKGVKVAITTDMHHVDDLDHLHFGIGIARRGWLDANDVINTWDLGRLTRFLRQRREKFCT
jgi:DNA polymerase (family 10)